MAEGWYDPKELVIQASKSVPTQPEFDPVSLDDEAIRIVNDYKTIGFYIPRASGIDQLAVSELDEAIYDWDAVDGPDGRTEGLVAGVNAVFDLVEEI